MVSQSSTLVCPELAAYIKETKFVWRVGWPDDQSLYITDVGIVACDCERWSACQQVGRWPIRFGERTKIGILLYAPQLLYDNSEPLLRCSSD
jgi:hypothetical protein